MKLVIHDLKQDEWERAAHNYAGWTVVSENGPIRPCVGCFGCWNRTMQFVKSDVATICTGMAASMGAVLLVAGKEGKRAALPHSRIMIHQPMGGAQGQASDMEITVNEIKKLKNELYQIIADHSHNSVERIAQDSDRDHWMTAVEAKEYGMIDTVYYHK